MSINVNIRSRELTNLERWKKVKNGDFVILDSGNVVNPIQSGLYRVFFAPSPDQNDDRMVFLCPMFTGNFEEGMYPYSIVQGKTNEMLLPAIKSIVNAVNIDVEV